MLEKIELDEIVPSSRKYPFIEFKPNRESGKEILSVSKLSKTIDGKKILNNVSFTVERGDKIAVVGTNNIAKTTLFKILMGEMKYDSGKIEWGSTITKSYFPQDNSEYFVGEEPIMKWIGHYYNVDDETVLRGFLGRMLFSGEEVFKNDLLVEKRWKLLLDGLWETVFISFFSIIIGTILGCLICALRMSRRKLWRGITIGYTKIMHGMPILVFLMIMFYIVFAPTQVTATWVAIIAFAMNFGAFVSEMFLSGIQSVDHGQVEAGRALGFSKRSTFVNFVLPQALHRIFPVYKGEAISLIKNTSIVGYIAIQDITNASDIIRSRTFDAFFPLIIITIIYFILAWILGAVLDYINKKTTHA